MSTFDAEIFANAVTEDAERILRFLNLEDEARVELIELRRDVEATMAALEIEKEPRRARALVHDLETFLPARRDKILYHLVACSSATIADLGRALVFTERATLAAARSFTTMGGV